MVLHQWHFFTQRSSKVEKWTIYNTEPKTRVSISSIINNRNFDCNWISSSCNGNVKVISINLPISIHANFPNSHRSHCYWNHSLNFVRSNALNLMILITIFIMNENLLKCYPKNSSLYVRSIFHFKTDASKCCHMSFNWIIVRYLKWHVLVHTLSVLDVRVRVWLNEWM